MTTRARRPTDETGTDAGTDTGTEVYTPERQRALFGASPGERIASSSESWDQDATDVDARSTSPADRPTLQVIDQTTPTEVAARPERSEPIRMISMKERAASEPRPARRSREDQDDKRERGALARRSREDQDDKGERGARAPRAPLHVQLRSMAEVAGVHASASGLGRLAPPRDPQQARKRRQRDNVVWACVAVLLACAISLGIWLIAGR